MLQRLTKFNVLDHKVMRGLLSFNRSWHMLTLHLNTYGLLIHVPQHIKSDAEITMIKAEVHVSMYVQMQNVCAES